MEEIEKKLFEKIKETAMAEKLDLSLLARSRIKSFAAVLHRLVIEEGCHFDIVVGGGNSGLYTLKIAEYAYDYLGLSNSRFVKLPVVRSVKDPDTGIEVPFDNSVLIPSAKEQLEGVEDVRSILFVDDEIRVGTTARASFEVILEAVYGDLQKVRCSGVIVAEHHFFEWHHDTPYLSIRFFSNGVVIPGVNNLISYFLPDELFEEVQAICNFDEATKRNRAMSLVVGGALKADKVPIPYYDSEKELVLVEQIEGYTAAKDELLVELRSLVEQGIEEYKEGKIRFKF